MRWRRCGGAPVGARDRRLRNVLLFFVEQAIWGMSVLARYAPTHYSQVNQYLTGVFCVGSQIAEVSPWYILDGKLRRLAKAFEPTVSRRDLAVVSTGDCGANALPDDSIDYVFTDPPFGENIFYADLNHLVESWHRHPDAQYDRGHRRPAERARASPTISA